MIYFFSFCLLSAFNIFVFKLPLFMSQCCLFLYLYLLCFLYLCIVSCLHLPNSDPLTQISHEPHYKQSSTTNKNFSSLYPLFFFFFCFLPCHLSLPNSNSTPLFPIPYYYVQLMSNYQSTKHLTVTTHYNLYSLYLSFYFFYLYNARQQEPQTQSQSQKPKKKKKHKQISSATTQAPNHQISSVTSVHQ